MQKLFTFVFAKGGKQQQIYKINFLFAEISIVQTE